MTDATDVVWVSAHASSLTPKRYHTDADCPYLHKSGDSPTAKSLSLIDSHYEQCQWCAGEMDSEDGSDPNEYTSILASADPDDIGRPMTDGGEDRVPVCPECGSVSVREKLSDPRNDSRKSAEDWYCHKCNAHFPRPDERPRSETDARPHNPGSSDLVQRLLDADPEEVGDEEHELVTDGGQEMVLVVEGVGTYNHKTFHTDADCYQIARAAGEPVEKPLRVLNDSYQECRFCAGTADPSHPEEYDPNEYKRILVDADPDEVGRPMTDGGQDSVWVVGRGTCGNNDRGARVYHTDRDCPNLGISKGSIHQKPLGVVPDNWDECALCAGADIDKSSKSEPFRALLDADPDEVGRPMTDGGANAPSCCHGRMTRGIPNCHAEATHTGGSYYPGPVCDDHKKDDSVSLGDDDSKLMTDGGEDLVYVVSGRIARCATFHRDPDCSSLKQTDRLVEKPIDVLPDDATECKLCGAGDWTPKGGSGKLEATRILEEADPDDVGRPMTDGGEETVWLAQKKGHWNRTTYHTDPDCSRLRMSAGEPISKPISVLGESFDECSVCADGMDTSHTGTSLAARLLDADPEDVGRPMTDGGQQMTTACPECDSARITRRTKTGVRERWRCKECGSQFDEAVSRESRSHNHSTHGTARALEEMDPEDLGDGELVTDGGRTLPSASQAAPPEIDPDDVEDGDRVVVRAERPGGRQIRIVGTARPDRDRGELVVEETDPDWTWLLSEGGTLWVDEGGHWRRQVATEWSLHRFPATDGGESQRDVGTHHLDDPPEYEYDVGQTFKLRDDPDPEGYVIVKSRVWNYDADLDDATVKLLAYKQYLVGDVLSLGGNERLVTEDTLRQHYEPVDREEAKEVLHSDV